MAERGRRGLRWLSKVRRQVLVAGLSKGHAEWAQGDSRVPVGADPAGREQSRQERS